MRSPCSPVHRPGKLRRIVVWDADNEREIVLLTDLASMLRLNLFTYRDLRDWLDDPFNTPPLQALPEQLELALS